MRRALHALPDFNSESSHSEEHAERLLLQISQQDHFALDTLYKLWAPTLLGIAFRMLGSRQEAEEALQDTFVKLWHRAADYDPAKSKAFVWSFTILRSVCIDHLRYHRRQKRDSSKNITWDERDTPEPQADSIILSNDSFATVRQALDRLPPDERRCLELAVLLEYTHSEISDELKTPLGTVKNRLRRAMEKLKFMLKNNEI